jgi:hypothetical protein
VSVGGLLAAAVADPHRHRALGGQLVRVGVGAGDGVDVKGSVEESDPLGDEDVGGVLGLGRLVEPAGGGVLVLEGREGPDRGGAGEWEGGWGVVGLRLPCPPASTRRWRRRPQSLDYENALALVARARPGQIATVRQGQRAGEVELRESE